MKVLENVYGNSDRRCTFDCVGPSMTCQSAASECDVVEILKRSLATGLPPGSVADRSRPLSFGDFSTVTSFEQAVLMVDRARETFLTVPAAVRARFDNDPAKFVEFCSDPANLPELQKLGLTTPTVEPAEKPAVASSAVAEGASAEKA